MCPADPGLLQVTRLREQDKYHLCCVRNRTPEISKNSLGEAEGVPREGKEGRWGLAKRPGGQGQESGFKGGSVASVEHVVLKACLSSLGILAGQGHRTGWLPGETRSP